MNSLIPLSQDLSPPPDSGGRLGVGAILAALAHVMLVLALAWGVNWNSHTPDGVEAELWSAVPQIAAPRAAEPTPVPPTPEPPKPKPTPPKPKPETPPPPTEQELRNAQIAVEKAKREEQKVRDQQKKEEERDRREKEQREQEKERKKELEKKKREDEKKAEAEKEKRQEQAEQRKAKEQQEKTEAARQQALKRMLGQADGTNDQPGGKSAQTSGPSAGYAGRIKARVKPNIVFADNINGNPVADVEVRLSADGHILSQRIIVSSGSKEWDEAVLRAIERTEVLPRDIDGKVPPVMVMTFKPHE